MIEVTFDGIKLTDYFIVSPKLKRNIASEWENTLLANSVMDGSKFKKNRLVSKTITMPFTIINDIITKKREIAKILNVKTPKKLIFSDEPNIYYEAVPDGSIDLDEIFNHGVGSVDFLIPDGIAHATSSKTYTQDSPEFDTDTFTINNEGTYRSWPILEATMPADNGVVAFINDRGKILQFGNPDEADTKSYTQSDRVIWDTTMIQSAEATRGWKTNQYTFPGLWDGKFALNCVGTRKFGSDSGYGFVTPDSYGTASSGFKGISYGRKVSPDSEGHIGAANFESRHGIWFETGNIKQTGIFLTELRDSTGAALCSVVFFKTASSNNVAKIRINVRGNVKEWSFQPTAWNFYTKKGREFSIVKNGNTLDFHVGGIVNGGFIHTVRIDELKDIEVTDVVYYIGIPVNGTALSHMKLTHSTLRKDKVKKIADIKNMFGENDTLTIDTASGAVALNGSEIQLGAFGNDWEEFYLEPGENKIKCIYSDWAQAPTFKITNQEAYL